MRHQGHVCARALCASLTRAHEQEEGAVKAAAVRAMQRAAPRGRCGPAGFAGEPGAACRYLGSVHPPGALMLASERFPDFTIAPCPLLRPSIKLLALLRDPGERAQSAFAYNYEACVCNFRHPWCTQFSSFRFKNRQTKLCDDHTPKHGFASALAVLRQHGNMPWPITSSETHHVLGRFTAGVVREAYAPYFGGYQATPGGPWKSSPLLARATLARCFAWVGIAEE